MSAETTTKQDAAEKDSGSRSGTATNPNRAGRPPHVITNPGDVASVVLMQVDNVNAKKDELTIAIKGLTDTAKQLVRAYAEHAKAIQKLQARIKALEAQKQKG